MSTAKQIAANRLNSQKSSGPRSAQGKAASSANSLKTGLYARSQIIAGEDPAELRVLADQYFLRWEPATPEESFLVATLIDADWLLRRYSLADAKIWDYHGANDLVRDDPNAMGLNFIWCREEFPLLQRRIDSAERSFHRALHSLERLRTKRRAAPQSTPAPVADRPPEAKPNFAQPQSAQQTIGFVPSFSPVPDSAGPTPVEAAVAETATHPYLTTAATPGGLHTFPPSTVVDRDQLRARFELRQQHQEDGAPNAAPRTPFQPAADAGGHEARVLTAGHAPEVHAPCTFLQHLPADCCPIQLTTLARRPYHEISPVSVAAPACKGRLCAKK